MLWRKLFPRVLIIALLMPTSSAVAAKTLVITIPRGIVRIGPAATRQILLLVQHGETFPMLEASQGWYKLRLTDGREGWIASAAVQIRQAAKTPEPSQPPAAAPGPVQSNATPSPEAEMWALVKHSTQSGDFHDFLVAFPAGPHAPLARLKLKKLRQSQTSTAQAALTPTPQQREDVKPPAPPPISPPTETPAPARAIDFFNDGINYLSAREYEKATTAFTQAIERNPKDSAYYNNRAIAYMRSKKYSQAIQDLNRSIEMRPNDFFAYSNRGLVYTELKNYQNAIRDFSKAIELNPDDPIPYFNRGRVYTELGQREQAKQDYDRVIQLKINSQ